ncbi:efflux RND transporter periplasmic adaptor subunit [Alkaliflexus imshenetskii]|uniref:efflux RND transporter periplasmic adaptor subunit n=1 Tax=Alkaliflexus imshenetskii TaxID=286730 RepID=UPI00047AF48F|nr:efflux RND transporter periplasmic adaptor subunit [Alkaliflexus imshenetskii]
MNTTLKRTLLILLVLVVLGIIILPKTNLFKSEAGGNGNSGMSRSLPVSAVALKPEAMENALRSAGTLVASEEVDVTTEISGIVREIYFQEGSRVKKGDLLLRIDDAELQAQRDKAIHQRELIKQTFERQQILLEKEAISREAFDRVQTDLLVIESEIKLLDTRIAKMQIRAPFEGLIGFRYVSPGTFMQPGMRVARLVKNSPLRLEFSVPERYQSEVLSGRTVYFNVAGFNETFEAVVYAVEPSVDARTRSVVLRATYPNSEYRLLPGMFADLRIIISREEDVVQVPSEAIIPQMDGELVFVYRNGRAVQTSIRTGTRTERTVAVVEGLAAGDTVITSGILQLRSGMPVTILNR